MLKQGSLFDNRYVLTRFIGRGGFAEVWLVTDNLTGLEEALKIYAPGSGMDEDGLKLFVKELSVVHDLRHSSLLTPKILGQCDNQPYLVLPFCPNGSLNKYVGQCTEEQAWKILEQVASGLAYLHKRNIVHQDIKPDNILLDANNDCVITDFGISLKAQSTLRKSMRIQANSGTMAYMAPERFSAEPHPIPANDVWSLGAMMFELLEGNVPFLAQMGGLAQMNGALLPTMHSDASANLKQVILSMLTKDVETRPTAEQIAEIARTKGAQQPAAAAKPKRAAKKEPSVEDSKKTQIIGNINQPAADDKKTKIINTGAQEATYSRPNRFEQETTSTPTNTVVEEPQPKKKKKWVWWLVCILAFAAGFVAVYTTTHKDTYYYDQPSTAPAESAYYDGSTSASQMETANLSVSQSDIYVGASSGSETITVTCNKDWQLINTSSSMFTVSRIGNSVTINYSANPNASSRSDYFDVETTDGAEYVRITIYQDAKENTRLSVSNSTISASANGTTEYITVNSNTSWDVEYPNGDMYSVTRSGNTLTVKIYANTSSESRSDYFFVNTNDGKKQQKITLNQSGASTYTSNSTSSYAEISDVRVDYNEMVDGKLCMKFHVSFSAYYVLNHKVGVCMYFKYTNTGEPIKDTNNKYYTTNGYVAHSDNAVAPYEHSTWSDFVLSFPHDELHVTGSNVPITVEMGIYDWTTSQWLTATDAKKIYIQYSSPGY